ncbi:MAG: tyrosine-type recombinase/integrase [Treponema sp.]|nr:tyrosine-type recombinase/integrase [Treponema sp.]
MNESIGMDLFCGSVQDFLAALYEQEKAAATMQKYVRDVHQFIAFAQSSGQQKVTKPLVMRYKEKLGREYKKSTANGKLISLGIYLRFLNCYHLHARTFPLQRTASLNSVLTAQEYKRLVTTAERYGKQKISAIVQTLACTGVRISELRYFTVEALSVRNICITNKGKTREIILPDMIFTLLKTYCKHARITSGIIFCGKNRNAMLDKAAIWRAMQRLARLAQIDPKKVHAHNFRHLFAKSYMQTVHNMLDLADILGHSSLETTRLYTRTSCEEKRVQMNNLADRINGSIPLPPSQQSVTAEDFLALYTRLQTQLDRIEHFFSLWSIPEKSATLLL